ncbi:hypothetical protein [Blastococcus sp. TF02A-35]|uniref:hypothetical protein n=1 Tax=Blastococcus sp. TF02A-35 TaxID=2559612 RepID=UPI0010734BF0|nr:hypothetical protein [Blastococcus sp. TF02A_35]TFV53804.1 hypothetical protein E4P43_00700 [Blastococcus sp. TF02A_35]
MEGSLTRPSDAPDGLPRLAAWWEARSACQQGVYAPGTVWELQVGRLLHDYIEDYLVPYGRWVLHDVPPSAPTRREAVRQGA